jgi:hypothetical protein
MWACTQVLIAPRFGPIFLPLHQQPGSERGRELRTTRTISIARSSSTFVWPRFSTILKLRAIHRQQRQLRCLKPVSWMTP